MNKMPHGYVASWWQLFVYQLKWNVIGFFIILIVFSGYPSVLASAEVLIALVTVLWSALYRFNMVNLRVHMHPENHENDFRWVSFVWQGSIIRLLVWLLIYSFGYLLHIVGLMTDMWGMISDPIGYIIGAVVCALIYLTVFRSQAARMDGRVYSKALTRFATEEPYLAHRHAVETLLGEDTPEVQAAPERIPSSPTPTPQRKPRMERPTPVIEVTEIPSASTEKAARRKSRE